MGKAWADVHNQAVIPSHRRLYLTATPRIWEERLNREVAEGVRDPLPREMAASMDDEKVFGPVLYKLSLASAVSRGLLARYQIIVLELKDPVVTPERLMGENRHTEEVRGQRLGALQAALLHTMAQHNLQTCITFHHRTIEAQAYAEGLERVAAKLHANEPETYPARIWADWLCGEHVPEHRREVLSSFATTARRAVLSNCRVLGEGVDIRAVDSVALLDPKGAPHDIVQAIGRALRQKPGQGKLASLIVPVFLQPGERPEDMFTSGSGCWRRPGMSDVQGVEECAGAVVVDGLDGSGVDGAGVGGWWGAALGVAPFGCAGCEEVVEVGHVGSEVSVGVLPCRVHKSTVKKIRAEATASVAASRKTVRNVLTVSSPVLAFWTYPAASRFWTGGVPCAARAVSIRARTARPVRTAAAPATAKTARQHDRAQAAMSAQCSESTSRDLARMAAVRARETVAKAPARLRMRSRSAACRSNWRRPSSISRVRSSCWRWSRLPVLGAGSAKVGRERPGRSRAAQ
jgi:hypothetical protein